MSHLAPADRSVTSRSLPAESRSRATPRRSDAVTWLTLYLVVLFAIPSRLVVGALGSAGAPSMIMGLTSLALWAAMLMLRRRSSKVARFYPMRWALLILFAVSAVSYILAMARPLNRDEMSPADVAMISLLCWAGTMLLAADWLRTRKQVNTITRRLAFAGMVLAALGLAQFFTEMPIVDVIQIPGLTEVSSSSLFERNGLIRPNGTATHPIEYGAILAIILPVALHVALHDSRPRWLLRWLAPVAIGAVIGISGSRSAYVCALVGVLVASAGWTPKLRRWILGLGLSVLVLTALVWSRLMRIIVGLFDDPADDPSINSRTDSFEVAWEFFLDHPFFGRGYGTFLPKYRIFDNQYLVQLVSVGLVGVVALIGIGAVAVYEMRWFGRTARKLNRTHDRGLAGALAGAVAAGFVSMLFFDAFAFPMTMGALFLVLGIVASLSRQARDSERPREPRPTKSRRPPATLVRGADAIVGDVEGPVPRHG